MGIPVSATLVWETYFSYIIVWVEQFVHVFVNIWGQLGHAISVELPLRPSPYLQLY